MTKNQLQYWANQETIRSNKAKEAINKEGNQVKWAEHSTHERDSQAKVVFSILELVPKTIKAIGSIL